MSSWKSRGWSRYSLALISHWLKVTSKGICFRLCLQTDQASSTGISESPGGLMQAMLLRGTARWVRVLTPLSTAGAAGDEMHQWHLLQSNLLHCSHSSMSLTTSTQPVHFQGGDWLQFLIESLMWAGILEEATVLPTVAGVKSKVGTYHLSLQLRLLDFLPPQPTLLQSSVAHLVGRYRPSSQRDPHSWLLCPPHLFFFFFGNGC